MRILAGTSLNIFPDIDAMRTSALAFIVARLSAAIDRRGKALLLASGGSTPLPVYKELGKASLDWAKIDIALVDERWVPADHQASNERAVRASLLAGEAEKARFTAMKTDHQTPEEAVPALDEALRSLAWPADVVVLGMGPDGHTASWFPNARGLDAAIDPETDALCAAVDARESAVTGAHTQRMTLTAPPILSAGAMLLLMTGEDKKETFARARASGPVDDMPVRTLFLGKQDRLFCCWAP